MYVFHLQAASPSNVLQAVPFIEAEDGEEIYIPIIAKGLQFHYWDAVQRGAERAARDYNVEATLEGPREETQVQEQLDAIEKALARNPQAMVLSAIDSQVVRPYLESAQRVGIPVIGIDSGVDSPIVRTTVATDNYGAGSLAAEKMAELLGETGQVAMIIHDDTSQVAIDRRDGFVDTITQRYPGMEVVTVKYGRGEPDRSAELAKEIIEQYPGIQGLFGGNEGSAHGIIRAIREVGNHRNIQIIGFDSGRELIDAIREGLVAGAVTQNPIAMGYLAVETALRAYRGEILPSFIDTGYVWYDRSNIDNSEIQELLYE